MLGVFGGTFDPIHYGHLRPVAELRAALELAPVLFIPCATPPHRPAPVASASHRWQMVRRAVVDYSGFAADDRELRRGGVSYMVDTLLGLGDDYGGETLCLIIGTDALQTFDRWHRWEQILALCNLVVMTRPGGQTDAEAAELPAWALPRRCGDPGRLAGRVGSVYLKPVAPVAISATRIRRAIADGEDVGELMPPAVWHYIREHGLYGYGMTEPEHV